MPEIVLKDWYGKEQTFDRDVVFAANPQGELEPFTHGVVKPLEIAENGTFEAPEGVAGYSPVVVNVAGSSADVRYVTFMSEDGTVEYGKKAVAVGDDCADPIARGIFAKPTKPSDAQYNYTFYDWATEPNGGADASWNKAITEDKTVYANFSASVRYYTITYYDDNGTTVLKTESLAYGAMPSYVPEKDGYGFGGWNPELATVTGDASYIAVWTEKISFATASWADIAEISNAGEAQVHFAIGDTKEITLTDGQVITVKIVGFDHDTIYNSTKKAGISIVCETIPTQTVAFENVRTGVGTAITNLLPTSLKNVVKTVSKLVDASKSSGNTTTAMGMKFWVPDLYEMGGDSSWVTTAANMLIQLGTAYEGLKGKSENNMIRNDSAGVASEYYFRNYYRAGSGAHVYYTNNGFWGVSSTTSGTCKVLFGFCI